MKRHNSIPLSSSLISISSLFFLLLLLITIMAASAESGNGDASVHIVYTSKPEGEEPEAFNVKTLASVLGSEDTAKEAIIYHYQTAASGFSCKLTPEQVARIKSEPGVLQVVKSQTLRLHGGPARVQKS